ncbi:hypothetical protein O1611_g6718 [Lasiodiplodia mahajangana]|uniref:Uncharacterized protein n=1 Tax=Lasiodiplodia mahajangana TaxID=1108764 RepID=A0ACC2JHD6_9PEZI|nr:hypothetical protein O1611_g6718 [Lasiodiplodia mahajangana]
MSVGPIGRCFVGCEAWRTVIASTQSDNTANSASRQGHIKTSRTRRRETAGSTIPESPQHIPGDLFDSRNSSILPRPSVAGTDWNITEITPNSGSDDGALGPSHRSSILRSVCGRDGSRRRTLSWSSCETAPIPRLRGQLNDLVENNNASTSEEAPQISSMAAMPRPAPLDNTTSFQRTGPNTATSSSLPQTSAPSATPNRTMLSTPFATSPDQQEHKHHMPTIGTAPNQAPPPPRFHFAYVEDATDSDEAATRTDSLDSLVVETSIIRDNHHHTIRPEQSRSYYDKTLPASPPPAADCQSNNEHSDPPSDDRYDGHASSSDGTHQRFVSLSRWGSSTSQYHRSQPSLADTEPRPRYRGKIFRGRTLRPRRTDTPSPPPSSYPNYRPFPLDGPAPGYGTVPLLHYGYGPHMGLDVPPYNPSVPVLGYDPYSTPYNPYHSQYKDSYIPPRHPNYIQYQQGNPSYFTTYPNYRQSPLPPPPSTIVPEPRIKPQPSDSGAKKLASQQEPKNAFYRASAIKAAPPYKAPVSSDPSGHGISFPIPLKRPSMPENHERQKSVVFSPPYGDKISEHWKMGSSSHRPYRQSGKTCLTRIQSLEYYVDRSSQDRITILPSQLLDMSESGGIQELRWLHLQQDKLCLSYLRELIRGCQHLDEDLRSLTDSFLEVECARFEKRYSSGSHHGYYIEPGTVLRCDVGYGQELNRGAKSIFFCSVPYLQLGKLGEPNDIREEANMHIHPARTLMESLYDYELPDGRDSRQAIRRCSSPEQDNILYIPQTWYILCGSDVLISYSRLSLDEIRGDSIKARDESKRSLIAVVTDLDNYQFSVALKTTESYFSVRASIEALRSNAGGNTIRDYDLVFDSGEHLIAKNWLDIVNRDPLPSLKITLKFRSEKDKRSLALIAREASSQFAKKYIADSSASDNDDKPQSSLEQQAPATRASNSRHGGQPNPQSWSARRRRSARNYASTSYMGLPKVDTNDLNDSDNAAQYPETFDRSYAPTLVGGLVSRQDNGRRRIQDLECRGIIINDVFSVSNEPEVFSVTEKALETGTKPSVRDCSIDKWEVRSHSPDDPRDTRRDLGSQDGAIPTAGPSSPTKVKERTQEIKSAFTTESPDAHRSHQSSKQSPNHNQGRHLMVPFLQWDGGKTGKCHTAGDIIVHQVLDQVHDRLLKSSEHFKRYGRSHTSTLETLKIRENPLQSGTNNEQLDKIVAFRRKIAQEKKSQLLHSSEELIQMFIPLNFDHEATRKVWGAIYVIYQILESIFRSEPSDSGDSYLVQDYTNDSDLVHSIALTQPKVPMNGCTRCASIFQNLEDGITHLISVHFYPDSDVIPGSANENLRLWLRTPDQVQLEARIHIFLTFIEECINALQRLAEVADDLHLGSFRASETKGYPVFESLVRVFEHITSILVFACDFMVKMERTIRKDHHKALNGSKFMTQFKSSLDRIVQGAQKNLEQAKIDMILASRTESRPGVVTLASIGPEFLIATISNGLFFRKLKSTRTHPASAEDDVDVGEVYMTYANKLQLQVNQRPQKRLLPDIYALEEELDVLQRLNQWQRKFCHDFIRVLDPSSYKITTKSRFSHFRTENRYLLKILRRLEVRSNELHSLQKRTEKLRDQLQQNIEIEEESHGKAIRVFTFVTILFLPLSFVTSFFGMNTVDIRDIDQDQRLFWIVSVPTTAFVIGIAYLYGYKWENWKERLSQTHGPWFANPGTERGARIFWSTSVGGSFRRPVNKDDLEKGIQRRGTVLSSMGGLFGTWATKYLSAEQSTHGVEPQSPDRNGDRERATAKGPDFSQASTVWTSRLLSPTSPRCAPPDP